MPVTIHVPDRDPLPAQLPNVDDGPSIALAEAFLEGSSTRETIAHDAVSERHELGVAARVEDEDRSQDGWSSRTRYGMFGAA